MKAITIETTCKQIHETVSNHYKTNGYIVTTKKRRRYLIFGELIYISKFHMFKS